MNTTPYTINFVYTSCLLRTREQYEESITVPGLSAGAHTFHKKRLERHYMCILSAVKGLPRIMRYSQNREGAPWILARGSGSRYEGMTLESAERLILMAVALGMIRVLRKPCTPCDLPNIVIDDEKLHKMEMMEPKGCRRTGLIRWK